MQELPSVSVVIPNWNGADLLPACLDSLQALDYPDDLVETIVVDNGSIDGSRDLLQRSYPNVRIIANTKNLGFAAASNSGAEAATSQCVAFLNNDMRVDRAWLRGLVGKFAPRDGYVCVGGVILDWEGKRLDFAGGWVNFVGSAGNTHVGKPLDEGLIVDGRDLPFACGGSMLIERDAFTELGGFDETYFAFFEDVDLGWRLWLAGYGIRLAARARAFHRGHSTASAIPRFRHEFLLERNALLTLIKNVDDDHLASVLTSALFLLAKRSVLRMGSAREAFAVDGPDDRESEFVTRLGLAPLHAACDVLADLPRVLERRRDVQARRKREDHEIFALFDRPFRPSSHDEGYLEAALDLRAVFGLDRLFTRQRVMHALVVGDERSDRLQAIARDAAVFTKVAFVSPGRDHHVLEELLAESDLVIADAAADQAATIAASTSGLLVVDLARGAGVRPELERRADVFLGPPAHPDRVHRRPDTGDRPLLRFEPGSGTSGASLRQLVEEPWRWRREAPDGERVAVPEDLQSLLRRWREQRRRGGRVRRAVRAAQGILPSTVEGSLRRALRRPRVGA